MDILEVITLLSLCIACSERTPAYRGESFLLQREQHYSSEELLQLTLSPQA